jgi:hypothetical protein
MLMGLQFSYLGPFLSSIFNIVKVFELNLVLIYRMW